MPLIVRALRLILAISLTYPRLVIATFVILSIFGYSCAPKIVISSNLIAGVGDTNSIISINKENGEIFGEQDSLIVVLEFPEPPGSNRLEFVRQLGDAISNVEGVRRVRYRWLDPEDYEHVSMLFGHFLLGMNERERQQIQTILSPSGIEESVRRTRNRLFLVENPYLQTRILQDPLELGQFVSSSMERRVGAVSLGDTYLLIGSPDSTVYLIQVTPDFPSADIVKGKALMGKVREVIPNQIAMLSETIPVPGLKSGDLKWHITGKTAFHNESDRIFDEETFRILTFSFGMVLALMVVVYRSGFSGLVLMAPIAAGVGPNYGVIYLSYTEVNPVVMGATGVLFGLGADYGVHLWNRFREELDAGRSPEDCMRTVYEQTGPPVALGAMTSILAFLCLCLSEQPAMAQFGYVGAIGLALTFLSTAFLIPAIMLGIKRLQADRFPRMRVSFGMFARFYQKGPVTIVIISAAVICVSFIFASRVSHEKDLQKVFLARNMDSMSVSNMISKKFRSNFSQPTLLSFDTDDFDAGLLIQRKIDSMLEELMVQYKEVASFDSISYLVAPESVRGLNQQELAETVSKWPELENAFTKAVNRSGLSEDAVRIMRQSFDGTGQLLRKLSENPDQVITEDASEERSWYSAKIRGKYRFLTQIRYSEKVTNPKMLKEADQKMMEALSSLPVEITLTGPRQVMEEILSGLVSELVRLALYVLAAVIIFFFTLFHSPLGVALSLIPMAGAFCMTLGVMGLIGYGLPFSIVGVAPLIFGLGMDNGVHLVMGSLGEEGSSVEETMSRVTGPIIFTSLTNVMGFVSMITSKHYSMEFLGWAMVIGMVSSVAITLLTLPAILTMLERRKGSVA